MPIKDPFSYSARWDSVELDCSSCVHFNGPEKWPDKNKTISCKLHNLSLKIELGDDCYKLWEWFCKNFSDNGKSFKKSVDEFKTIKEKLGTEILYRCYNDDGFLKEIAFQELRNL